jgi:inosine/xanthosine triphosphate pyrophosphatase family protein
LKSFVAALLEKVEKRMTVRQAEKHVWMLESSNKNKVRRLSSYIPEANDIFHDEMLRVTNASSKEEGSTAEEKTLFKNINLLSTNTFDLLDSDN